jgi:hypothetical protein
MKKYLTSLIALVALTLFATSCSTTYASRHEYFGYNNNPEMSSQVGETTTEVVHLGETGQTKWKNPLLKTRKELFPMRT